VHSETSYGCVLAARPGVAVRANLALKETGDLWVVRNSFSTCTCTCSDHSLHYRYAERVYVPAAAAAVRTACLALAPGSRVGTPPERASTFTLGAIASFADAAASASLPAGAPTKTERNAGFSGGED
jgi:hypothetical protein